MEDGTELRRLRREAEADQAEIASLRADLAAKESEVEGLREEDARLASSQRALIAQLRRDVGAQAAEAATARARLADAERELVDLRAVRDALNPPILEQRDGMTVASEFLPAAAEVGGDFYFVGDGAEDSTVVVVGDVVGKGLRAARRAAFTRTAFASVAAFSDDPARLLGWVNAALVERAGETADFVTAACVTYKPARRELRWAYAGHPPALGVPSGEELAAHVGVPLGLGDDVGCEPEAGPLRQGDGILMFTDGLTEAGARDDLYGLARVVAAVRSHPEATPAELLAGLRDEVSDFAGGKLGDDLCLVALRGD